MTPPNYLEQDFEEHIEQQLLSLGYHKRNPADYDKEKCLIPDEVIQFIQKSQPLLIKRNIKNPRKTNIFQT